MASDEKTPREYVSELLQRIAELEREARALRDRVFEVEGTLERVERERDEARAVNSGLRKLTEAQDRTIGGLKALCREAAPHIEWLAWMLQDSTPFSDAVKSAWETYSRLRKVE
jgi:predicted RNase H-like nuclease (RuvC/YqgF family)